MSEEHQPIYGGDSGVPSPGHGKKIEVKPAKLSKQFESKKLSQSFVVYHQMKKNLMQSAGVARGSRYQHPLLGQQPPLSEENIEEALNSRLLEASGAQVSNALE